MLIDIGGWMYGFFGPYGGWGVLLCIMLIFLIDALIFPTLPELFFVIGFIYNPTLTFGVELLFAAAIGEVIGITVLYFVVEKIHVPTKIKKIADRYVNFLVVSDERILLVNRVAPMIPFAGAFISIIDSWKLSRALFYIILGCFLKYGVILLMSSFFFTYFNSDAAQTYTIVFVFIVIIVSFIASFLKKKKKLPEKVID
ncbi:MAG: hypothetical protein WCR96_01815 [Candidatus Methanomethylophilaceae archaeon]